MADGEAGQPDRPASSPTYAGHSARGGVEAPDDLRGPVGQQPPGLGEPDPAPDPLQQPGPGLGLEPGQVWLTDGWSSAAPGPPP